MTTFRAELASALRRAGRSDASIQVPPAAVFWPDPERTWSGVIGAIQEAVPVLVLGERRAEIAQGPAIWIRAVLAAGTDMAGSTNPLSLAPHVAAHDERNPWVIYLPGIGRDAFANPAEIDTALAPLAELQFRSRWWLQSNQQPWTPYAFLRSRDGLGLDLAQDAGTRAAVADVLDTLLDSDVETLRRGPSLDAGRLNAMVVPDAVRNLLDWLQHPDATRKQLVERQTWNAFVGVCRQTYGFDPGKETPIGAAALLGGRDGPWQQVWDRFADAPARYPQVPALLDRAAPATGSLFDDDPHPDSWPVLNREAEAALRRDLLGLTSAGMVADVRQTLGQLDQRHGVRRGWTWAELGQAPLARALGHLAELARLTSTGSAGSLSQLVQWYADRGYVVDDLALRALAQTTSPDDRRAALAALGSVYDPWLRETARAFQQAAAQGYVGETGLDVDPGSCVVFVDGLRMDLGWRLARLLSGDRSTVALKPRLAAFPTVTPTGQPAVAPLTVPVAGGPDFSAADGRGRRLVGAVFRDALAASGVGYLEAGDTGDPSGVGWTQTNDIDSLGHGHDHKLAELVDRELELIASRVETLLDAGWRRIVIVTDHGFLLPARPAVKVELPLHLTEAGASRKPRAARLAAGQQSELPAVPWTWDPSVTMVSAPSTTTFEAGCLYEHGGLSPQECVIPVITVSRSGPAESLAVIEGLRWVGQRCRVDVSHGGRLVVEVRTSAGDPGSRVGGPKPISDGEAKVLVEDDALAGKPAYVVLVGEAGDVVDQRQTVVGGE